MKSILVFVSLLLYVSSFCYGLNVTEPSNNVLINKFKNDVHKESHLLSDLTTKLVGDLLPEDCGNVRPTWRGEGVLRETEYYEFPFYVELIYENDNKSDVKNIPPVHCGGTLISNKFILTAASCVVSQPKIVAVRLGEHDLNLNPDCYRVFNHTICAPPHVEMNITKDDIIIHNLYLNKTLKNTTYDIALIKLPKEVNVTCYAIEPICLPIKELYRKQGNLTLIGFPQLDRLTPRKNSLSSLAISYTTNSNCQILLNEPIENNYLCAAGGNRKEFCYGYGGSAIMYVVIEDYRLRWILAAIVPYGMSICDENNIPKVFPRMETFNNWVLENINKSKKS